MSERTLAIFGGVPSARGHAFPKDRVLATDADIEAAQRSIRSGAWSMFTSPDVLEFERHFASAVGSSDAVMVTSGTAAIYAALLALDLPVGARVGVPAYTYIGTCMPIFALGFEPVFIDVEETTVSLDPGALAEVSSGLDAVVMAHLFGAAGDWSAVAAVCGESGIALVHDCAQLFGDTESTELMMTSGPCCFSFGESKILRLGEGGAIATNSSRLATQLRLVRHQGEVWLGQDAARSAAGVHSAFEALDQLCSARIGLNLRPPAILATLGIERLPNVPSELTQRSRNAAILLEALEDVDCIRPLNTVPNVWWTLPVLVGDDLDRAVLLAALIAEGVPAGVHFPKLLPDHPVYKGAMRDRRYPSSERFCNKHLVLPIYPALGVEDVEVIAEAIRKVDQHQAELREMDVEVAVDYLRAAQLEELCQGLFFFVTANTRGEP